MKPQHKSYLLTWDDVALLLARARLIVLQSRANRMPAVVNRRVVESVLLEVTMNP